MRSCGSSGPAISGRGKIDGTAGTAAADPSPDASSSSRASVSPPSASFSSQTPIPSTPAALYARTSFAKLDARVVTCEIEKRGRMQGILRAPATREGAQPPDGALDRRRPQQVVCDQRSRPGPEPRARPRARADVVQPGNRRPVPRLLRERTPGEVLIERERA